MEFSIIETVCVDERKRDDHSWEKSLSFPRNVMRNDLSLTKIRKMSFCMKQKNAHT